jgi:methionine-rich copper-binding protein CopC
MSYRRSRDPSAPAVIAPARRSAAAASSSALLAVLLVLLSALPAAAHAELTSSRPGNGDRVTSPPSEVELTFSDPLEAQFTRVAVVDDAGTPYQDGEPAVSGSTVTQRVSGLPAAGRFTISYRVVSADGHPVTGKVRFVVTAPTASAATPSDDRPTPTDEAGPTAAQPPVTATPTGTAAASDAVSPAAATEDRPLGVLAALSAAAAAIGVAAYAWSRRRHFPPPGGTPTPGGSPDDGAPPPRDTPPEGAGRT